MQCLANPRYVNCACAAAAPVRPQPAPSPLTAAPPAYPCAADLAQNRLLSTPSMAAYLAYLQYWQQPAYARFLAYPAALATLQLLQSPEFRAAMAAPDATEHVWRQQFYAWQHGGRHVWAAQAPQWAGLPPAETPPPPADGPVGAAAATA